VDETLSVTRMRVGVISAPYEGEQAGGDVQYVSMCAGGAISRFLLADVAGHGADAAELGEAVRSLMRKHINRADQTRFARALNAELAAIADAGRFATAVLTTWHEPDGILVVTVAGHPPPLWYCAARGNWTTLTPDAVGMAASNAEGLTDLPLGMIEGTNYTRLAVPMEEGDLVVLYSDAFIEAADPAGRMPGVEGLLELASGVPTAHPADAARGLMEALSAWREGGPAGDDQTIMVLQSASDAGHRPGFFGRLSGQLRWLGLGRVQRR